MYVSIHIHTEKHKSRQTQISAYNNKKLNVITQILIIENFLNGFFKATHFQECNYGNTQIVIV